MPLWHVQYFPYANLPVVKNSPEARLPHRAVRFGSLLPLFDLQDIIFVAMHSFSKTLPPALFCNQTKALIPHAQPCTGNQGNI